MQTAAPTRTLSIMETETATFDTHGFVKRLTSAGMPEPQAEILAEEQSRLIQERLATKQDLERLRLASKQDLEQLRIASKRDIEELKAILEQKHKAQEAILEQKLKALEASLAQKLEAQNIALKHDMEKLQTTLERDIKEMEQKLTIKLGVIVSVGVTVLAVLFALLTTAAQ